MAQYSDSTMATTCNNADGNHAASVPSTSEEPKETMISLVDISEEKELEAETEGEQATTPTAQLNLITIATDAAAPDGAMLAATTTTAHPTSEEPKENIDQLNSLLDTTEEKEAETEETTDEQAVMLAPESSAATTFKSPSSDNLLSGCGGGTSATASIRNMLCVTPDSVEIAGDTIDEAQQAFLDLFSSTTPSTMTQDEVDDGTLDQVTADSNLENPNRRIWVVTTAALPWRTGTAVNPLLRALYLTRGRPKHYVTLVIPWLDNVASRMKLFGASNSFAAGGQEEQEEWIRRYCRERAHCPEEEENMKILFYPAVYQKSFGSIFPTVDICSLIPDKEADVAILDEPEHLNWFRAPPPDKQEKDQVVVQEMREEGDDDGSDNDDKSIAQAMKRGKEEYGWAFKFRHVVGILHTNYSAYMNQYAIGTSIIAAPAIGMLSSIVVRAYCHRVIRLSAVLPTLAPHKEVTCNVHGVRDEFLMPEESIKVETVTEGDDSESEDETASIYFIGKIMWAKGFDKVLEIQDHFRTANGHYFPMDIYGAGPDEKQIKRAFFGRNGKPAEKEATAASIEPSLSEEDVHAAEIFNSDQTLREQVDPTQVETNDLAIEVVPDRNSPMGSSVHFQLSPNCSIDDIDASDIEEEKKEEKNSSSHPLSVIGDLSTNSVATAVATSQAVYSLADKIVKGGMKMTMSWENIASKDSCSANGEDSTKTRGRFFIDPPKTTYEWRRTPIPARFLGVKDHAELRDVSEYKIFLNASVTEVLCTTTAEALAMGKFAIIPKHVSNEFFYQFPNCLTYESLAECVQKLEWALANTPTPLSEEDRYTFTWEAATQRLIESSGITNREMRERERDGTNKADARVAWMHFESGRTRQLIGRFFSRQSSALSGASNKSATSSDDGTDSETN